MALQSSMHGTLECTFHKNQKPADVFKNAEGIRIENRKS